ncbi:UPAR/Ly6 domain-containing protein crok-like [Maniola hyperantus]|uniref:UPAR/Ly6 domain-containing protein crok-like n=1 Tax=Aphantopus hyperantus TaxID=2795564 RepID=UPI001568ED7A|nr:uncharacterized protein LOC117991407 [Maniola hyperantus]
MTLKFVLSILLLTIFVRFGASIKCYECNSANNSMCLDPTIYDAESIQKYMRSTECERSVLAAAHAGKPMFCRKILQTILNKGHDPEVRVTRGCGWVKHRRDCYKADNEDHLETVCQCFSDNCNGVDNLSCSLLTVLTVSLGSIVLLL